MRTERGIGLALLGVAVAVVLAVTVTPGVGEVENAPLWCLRCIRAGGRAGSDFLLNVLLFVPVGVGLALAGVKRRLAIGVILLGTLGIETAQVSLVPGRFASLLDVAANGAGGVLGLVLGGGWRSILRPTAAVAARVSLGLGAAWLVTQAVTAWGLQPYGVPDAVRVRGVAVTEPAYPDGGVLDARIGRLALVSTRAATDTATARRMRSLPFVLTLRLVPAGPDARPTRFRIVDGEDRTFLGLAQQGTELRLRWRLRARGAGLRAPALILPEAFPRAAVPAPGAERGGTSSAATVRVGIEGGGLGLEVRDGAGRSRAARLRLTPNLAWSLLLGNLVPVHPVPTAGWIGAWMIVLGYWLGHADRARRARAARRIGAGAVLAIGWIGVPSLTGTAVPAVWEWAVAACAAVAGWYLAGARRGA